MAPPPEYDKEPKAPDKSATNVSGEESKSLHNLVNDQQTNSDNKLASTACNVELENNKNVEHLDDGQLKALLDEAITYKCPKDREGKSILFNELLEEVEQDEQALEAAARELSGGRATRRPRVGRRALPHSNSLQNLEQEALAPGLRRVRHAPHPHSNVSARAIHGGSLPSDVDKSSLGEEPSTRGTNYLATVQCVNPLPLAQRRVSASDANCPAEMELINRRSKPPFPMTYTARATLEIGSSSVCSGRAVTTTTASNQVDSAIPFNCITTSEVVDTCNTTSSASQPAVTEDLKPRSVMTSNFNGLPLARTSYGSTASTTLDEYKKSLDENGNSLQGFSSPLSGSSQHKKPRRKKSSKNETVINPQASDGYQGNKDLNEVLRFIESNADHGRAHKLGRAKHKDDDDKSKKRSTERRKDKETKIKRATSMEELSRTKLEDLTDKPKKEWGDGAAPAKAERRSWGDDARDSFFYCDEAEVGDFRLPSDQEASAPADADFQTVTKKRKPRRRADEAEAEPSPPRAPRAPSPRARRVSAPPSERSNDSNDDLDSVHSLPADQCSQLHCNTAEAVPPRPAASPPAPPPPPPLPPPPALPASYADIARTRHNIPDLIESCNFYLEGEEAAACPGDADGYPALQCRRRDKPPLPPPPPRPRDRKERTEVPQTECPAPDVVADRRPPVILLDSTTHPRDMDGITFGFDINEQLLGGPSRRPRCDLVRDALEGGGGEGAGEGEAEGEADGAGEGGARREGEGRGEGRGVAVRAGCVALRYVPPEPPPDTHHLHQIIDYIGSAWEDVVRCGGGKLRYFSE